MAGAARTRRAESDHAMNKKSKTDTDRPAPRPLFIAELGHVQGGERDRSPTTRSNLERGGISE